MKWYPFNFKIVPKNLQFSMISVLNTFLIYCGK